MCSFYDGLESNFVIWYNCGSENFIKKIYFLLGDILLMDNISAVILAAGEGKRMKSKTSKVLCEVAFKPMLNWVISACQNMGCKKSNICVVLPPNNQDIIEATNNELNYVVQNNRLGTGDAVKQALPFIANLPNNANILIMLGDAPLITSEVLNNLYEHHIAKKNVLTVLSANVKDPSGYGRIVRNKINNNQLLKIVEETECTAEEKNIAEINSGVMCFKKEALEYTLTKLENNNSNGEYYITSAISILLNKGEKVGVFNCYNPSVVLGANTKFQLMKMNDISRLKIIEELSNNGVEFISSSGVIISPDVKIGKNTVIYPGVILKGNTVIGNNCVITSNSQIEDGIVGNSVVIQSSYITNAKIGNNVKIGPFCNIRPNSNIADNVKIGDFVEVKNSNVGEKTSIAHLTYVGDSDVGKNVNFGCGCVTVNYNGVKKYRTVIGDNCFIGCNTNLIAPVKIGNNVYTAAGSTVTDDVSDSSLCIARAKQVVKKGWKIKNTKE